MARARGIPVVATLHDYTLVCPSGGQRLHRAEHHVCREIDVARCARCFPQSPFHAQVAVVRVSAAARGTGVVPRLMRLARAAARAFPGVATGGSRIAQRMAPTSVTPADIQRRLDSAQRVFDDVDLFVAPVPATAEEYARLGLPREKLQVSDYGSTPLTTGSTPLTTGATPIARGGRPLRIGFVGTLTWHKGAHVLLEAARMLPAGRFEIRLHGDLGVFPDYTAALRRAAEGLPVAFLDGFGREEVAEAFAGMDVLVVPSLWLENSPLVIHEAFLAGVPVVAARIGGIPDLVRDEEYGLLYDAESPAALAARLGRLIDDPDLLARLSGPRPRVKSIAQGAREWEERYSGLVAKSPG
jgi:glycosyltransferase involved in cell wall biosynthesis